MRTAVTYEQTHCILRRKFLSNDYYKRTISLLQRILSFKTIFIFSTSISQTKKAPMNYQTTMTDEKLIQFYLNGNPNALATLVELHKDRIYSAIYAMVQDKYMAEEIFQEVFIRIINNMIAGKTAEEGNFLQWAIRIAQGLCIEHSRKTKQSMAINSTDKGPEDEINFAVPVSVPSTMYYESHGKIKSMIDMLPEEQREVLVLNHYAGLSFKEIADVMKCSLNTALDTMKFGLNNLRKLMTEKEVAIN
jgi:RNA polymerase sigma factor (sigma-70 family)